MLEIEVARTVLASFAGNIVDLVVALFSLARVHLKRRTEQVPVVDREVDFRLYGWHIVVP
jgi:hypothetical protein